MRGIIIKYIYIYANTHISTNNSNDTLNPEYIVNRSFIYVASSQFIDNYLENF